MARAEKTSLATLQKYAYHEIAEWTELMRGFHDAFSSPLISDRYHCEKASGRTRDLSSRENSATQRPRGRLDIYVTMQGMQ